MSDPLIPFEGEKSKKENAQTRHSKGPQGKMPDFILLDDTQDFLQGNYAKQKESPKTQTIATSFKSLLILRFLCFLGMLLCFVTSIGMLIWTTLMGILAALMFFQSTTLNQTLRKFWRFYINSSVVALGLGIACLSPVIGFGLLIIYFSFKDESVDGNLLKKILKSSFKP